MSLAPSTPLPSFVAALVEEDHHVSSAEETGNEKCDGHPSMTLEEYKDLIEVLMEKEPRSAGLLPTYWFRTWGLQEQFGLPELELRDVPVLFGAGAADILNGWGYFMVTTRAVFKAGDLLCQHGPVNLEIRVSGSPDPFWWKAKVTCLRLEAHAVIRTCEVCGGTCPDDHHEDELGEE